MARACSGVGDCLHGEQDPRDEEDEHGEPAARGSMKGAVSVCL
jgi:hypothetical protein